MALRLTVDGVDVLIGQNVIGAGNQFNLIIEAGTSRILTWGDNDLGQLGNRAAPRVSPGLVAVAGLTGKAVSVAGGRDHSVALTDLGEVYTWGRNQRGELGTGASNRTANPDPVRLDLDGVTAVAAGSAHTMALYNTGQVTCWGDNEWGQLGDGTTTDVHKAGDKTVRVEAGGAALAALDDVVAIAAGYNHSLALGRDGTVWTWGKNDSGQLGDGTDTDRHRAVKVVVDGTSAPLSGVIAIASGMYHSMAVTADGSVWTWGKNDFGQLGDGTTTDRHRAAKVLDAGGKPLAGVVAVAGGESHTLALTGDGRVWAWGRNQHGQLGTGDVATRSVPVPVMKDGAPLDHVRAVASGRWHNLAVMAPDNQVLAWGANMSGQIGQAPGDAAVTTPTPVAGALTATPVAGGRHDFGSVPALSEGDKVTVTLDNRNAGELVLSGDITIDPAGEFVVDEQPSKTVAGKGQSTFVMHFAPRSEGTKTATLTLTSNDPDQPTVTLTLVGTATKAVIKKEPEIEVGRSFAVSAASYDFGTWEVGATSEAENFVIHNLGTADLTLSGTPVIAIEGGDAAEFAVEPTPEPSTPIAPHEHTTFAIRFAPTSEGDKSAVVHIKNNDADESDYTFTVYGRAVADAGEGANLEVSVMIPLAELGHDFGSYAVGTESPEVTFSLRNPGPGTLTLTGAPDKIRITGLTPDDFTITHAPRSTIPAGRSATFTMTFKPGVKGLREATVEIPHDRGPGTFTFPVKGEGSVVEPDIDVTDGNKSIVVDYIHEFAECDIGKESQPATFEIENRGKGDLTLTHDPAVYCDGGDTGSFEVRTQPGSPVSAGGAESFEVVFKPAAPAGDKKTQVIIESNDPDEPRYRFEVSGRATAELRRGFGGAGRLSMSANDIVALGPEGTVYVCPLWYGSPLRWTDHSEVTGFESVISGGDYSSVNIQVGETPFLMALALKDGDVYGLRAYHRFSQSGYQTHRVEGWIKSPFVGHRPGRVKALFDNGLICEDGRVFNFNCPPDATWLVGACYPVEEMKGAPQNAVALAGGHTAQGGAVYVLTDDGKVFATGGNGRGQLGRGSTGVASKQWKPVRDQRMNELGGIVAISGRHEGAMALAADGTVWLWGSNYHEFAGRSGDHATLAEQVTMPGGIKIRDVNYGVSCHLALTTEDKVVTWGSGGFGEAGTGELSGTLRPAERPVLGTAKGIATGYYCSAVVDAAGRVGVIGRVYGHHRNQLTTHVTPEWIPGLALVES